MRLLSLPLVYRSYPSDQQSAIMVTFMPGWRNSGRQPLYGVDIPSEEAGLVVGDHVAVGRQDGEMRRLAPETDCDHFFGGGMQALAGFC